MDTSDIVVIIIAAMGFIWGIACTAIALLAHRRIHGIDQQSELSAPLVSDIQVRLAALESEVSDLASDLSKSKDRSEEDVASVERLNERIDQLLNLESALQTHLQEILEHLATLSEFEAIRGTTNTRN